MILSRLGLLFIGMLFAYTASGDPVDVYTLTNQNGYRVKITDLGGIVLAIETPDRSGHVDDIVLGFDQVEDYKTNKSYFGAIVGRYANRIAKGMFALDGRIYHLPINDGPNTLHGGLIGFDKLLWHATQRSAAGDSLTLTLKSPDGDQGFPGTLQVSVVYTLTKANALQIDYSATTDRDTVINLTNHSYFNLAGAKSGQDILATKLRIDSEETTTSGPGLIPTGALRPVAGTPLDFRQSQVIGARIDQSDEQMSLAHGYDQNFVLKAYDGSLRFAAEAYHEASGRTLGVWTTQPAVQFYSGNFLDGIKGKGGLVYRRHSGFALETQHYPDSPNQPKFPSTVLRPGEEYLQTTVYQFGTRAN